MSGGYYGFDNGQHTEYGGWTQLGERARALHDVADKLRFWEMSPIDGSGDEYDSLMTQGPAGSNRQLLANPGVEYLAFFWGKPSSASAVIELPAGSYSYDGFDPRNGDLLASGTVDGGGTTSISPPAPSAWSGNVGVAPIITGS